MDFYETPQTFVIKVAFQVRDVVKSVRKFMFRKIWDHSSFMVMPREFHDRPKNAEIIARIVMEYCLNNPFLRVGEKSRFTPKPLGQLAARKLCDLRYDMEMVELTQLQHKIEEQSIELSELDDAISYWSRRAGPTKDTDLGEPVAKKARLLLE